MTQPFHILESIVLLVAVSSADVLAQVAAPSTGDALMPLLQTLGIPGAWLAVIAYTLRKIVLWGTPHAERMIEAYIARQASMAECQVKLTESTIAIQQENQKTLNEIKSNLPRLCQAILNPKP
ncbi:hypothetical protein [Prosthecobacter sp.]|jgi:hypothetical protein|uniref:hypothetical protein n=1 Tax=Prosthecobacter sp. TaxID=1965333 RepID=UPI0037CC9B66